MSKVGSSGDKIESELTEIGTQIENKIETESMYAGRSIKSASQCVASHFHQIGRTEHNNFYKINNYILAVERAVRACTVRSAQEQRRGRPCPEREERTHSVCARAQ
ncbi:hypothetical protein EVAR_98323_1 [Eumeta japonica]|uniref:Uncharacterized protein n=1 Tax=Eumeta variegata TaxID=151549 RepID=A0A4C1X9H4_EUMVA|nr:hypothetical protein EVAR_98323_1 [Eumeta japonica]